MILEKTWIRWVIIVGGVIAIGLFFIEPYNKLAINREMSQEAFIARLDYRIPELMEEYNIPGTSFAIVENGEIIWTQAYGYADKRRTRKMTPDTYCRVESISKSVTAAGIMKLVNEGKLELDQPVIDYLKGWKIPKSRYNEKDITIRQLLTHTSGLPLGDVFERYSPNEPIPSLRDNLTKDAVLFQKPGTSFAYSNIGYNLLELLIEEVTDQNFAEYMQEEIFTPLDMEHSSFDWSMRLTPEVPTGYDLNGNEVPVYIYPAKGSGGLFATAKDIATFISSNMMRYIETSEVQEIGIYNLVFDAYGRGGYIEELANGMDAISHGGQGGGIMTHYHFVPETGDGVVILTNSQRSWPFIARILDDWARWNGYAPLGMYNIILGQKILWLGVFLLWIWTYIRLKKGLIRKIPKWEVFVALILIASVTWLLSQKYLFMTSVFPKVSTCLLWSILVYGILILILGIKELKFIWKKDLL